MSPRYKKVLNDIRADLLKNFMLAAAIGIGVFGIGTILGGYTVLKREMAKNYRGTHPASATIKINKAIPIDQALVDEVRKFPGIETAERHTTVSARMKIGADWQPLLLFVKDDFQNMQANKVTHMSGAITPEDGSMLVERTAYSVMKKAEGDRLVIKTPNGEATAIALSGTVHDPGLAPAWQEETGYGYITLATLKKMGESRGFDELRIIVSDSNATKIDISEKAKVIAEWLGQRGYHVQEISVPPPNRHPHQAQMNTILSMFTIFSYMVLILGCLLVAFSISTLMVQQVRQIGIMKTIGANTVQISELYFIMIFLISLSAAFAAILPSRLAALIFCTKIATLLNIQIMNSMIPMQVVLIQMLSGVIIPLMAVAYPVLRGSRIKVRSALDNYGVANPGFSVGRLDAFLRQFSFLGEVGRLSLRNVLRKKSRLVMSTGLLAAGGAMFMTATNVSHAWDSNLEKIYLYRHYDLEVRLNEYVNPDALLSKIRMIPGIKEAEGWRYSPISFSKVGSFKVVNTYPDKAHGSFIVLGLPASSKLLSLPLQQGNWISNPHAHEVVLNQIAGSLMPDVKIGDTISFSVDDQPGEWQVAGFVEDVGSPATVFVSKASLETCCPRNRKVNMLRISYDDRNHGNEQRLVRNIESQLALEKISVKQSIPVSLLHNAVAEHMHVLVGSLLSMAVLMALIGALGLVSSMSLNIMERTREIGVLRTIGATPEKIRRLVMAEGVITGVFSIFIAFAISLPLSFYIGELVGDMAFRTPLPFSISFSGLTIWIAIIVGGSITAIWYPAQRAVRITTREALAYE